MGFAQYNPKQLSVKLTTRFISREFAITGYSQAFQLCDMFYRLNRQ